MIYVGFSTTNRFVSRLIRWITKATVSHTFFVVELYDKPWVVGAEFNGLTMMPMKRFQKKNIIKYVCRVPELTDAHLPMVLESLGEAYDFGGLFGGLFPRIGKWFKQTWKNPWANRKALICSEFVALTLQGAGIPGAEKLDPTAVTPEELKDFLIKHQAQ